MGKYPREEILAAFETYKRARDDASRTGDWSIWAAVFTEDAHYIEHAYGELRGRQSDALADDFQKHPLWRRSPAHGQCHSGE